MTAVLPVRRPGAASVLPPAGDPRLLIGHLADQAGHTLGASRARPGPWLVRAIVGLAVVAFSGLAVGPHVFGYRTMTMLTGSMAPEIEPGDVTVVTPLDVTDVTEGMVITYHIPIDDHGLVTHRVVSVEHRPDGTVTVQTKGDANEAIDPWTATLAGRHRLPGPGRRPRARTPDPGPAHPRGRPRSSSTAPRPCWPAGCC